MTPTAIADLVDVGLSVFGGVLVTLFGFRVIGKSEIMVAWHKKWGKHMRWLGPVWITLALIQYFVFK